MQSIEANYIQHVLYLTIVGAYHKKLIKHAKETDTSKLKRINKNHANRVKQCFSNSGLWAILARQNFLGIFLARGQKFLRSTGVKRSNAGNYQIKI